MSASKLKETSDNAAAAVGTATDAVRDYAKYASESVQHTAKQAAEQMRSGYDEAERFVRHRPGESMLLCLGVGIVAGVLVTMLFHSR